MGAIMLDTAVNALSAALWWVGGVLVGGFELIANSPEAFGQQLVVQTVLNAVTWLIIWYFVRRFLEGNERRRFQREFDKVLSGLWPRIAETHNDVRNSLVEVRDMVGRWYRTRLGQVVTRLYGAKAELAGDLSRYEVLFKDRGLASVVQAYKASLDNVIAAVKQVQASEREQEAHQSMMHAGPFSREAVTSLELSLREMNKALLGIAASLEKSDPAAADALRSAQWTPEDFDEIEKAVLTPLHQRAE
jgi:hypothetical protein